MPTQRSTTDRSAAPAPDVPATDPAEALIPGARLERSRLEQRARQLEGVLERLRLRVRASDAGQPERAGIHRAIGDFARELYEIRRQLGEPKVIAPRVRRLAKPAAPLVSEPPLTNDAIGLPPN